MSDGPQQARPAVRLGGTFGKMLRALRRDCWGCDNIPAVRGNGSTRCTCSSSTTDRVKEQREWLREYLGGRTQSCRSRSHGECDDTLCECWCHQPSNEDYEL